MMVFYFCCLNLNNTVACRFCQGPSIHCYHLWAGREPVRTVQKKLYTGGATAAECRPSDRRDADIGPNRI